MLDRLQTIAGTKRSSANITVVMPGWPHVTAALLLLCCGLAARVAASNMQQTPFAPRKISSSWSVHGRAAPWQLQPSWPPRLAGRCVEPWGLPTLNVTLFGLIDGLEAVERYSTDSSLLYEGPW